VHRHRYVGEVCTRSAIDLTLGLRCSNSRNTSLTHLASGSARCSRPPAPCSPMAMFDKLRLGHIGYSWCASSSVSNRSCGGHAMPNRVRAVARKPRSTGVLWARRMRMKRSPGSSSARSWGACWGCPGRGATGPLTPEGASRGHMVGHIRRTVVGVGYSPLSSQWRNVMVTRISRDSAPAGLIRSPRMSYQRLLTNQGILAI
jgi:hypothetical protein